MNIGRKIALGYVSFIKLIRISTIKIFTNLLFIKGTTYKKIIINRDGAFGDSIVALPALSIIRQNYPAARIDLLSVNNDGISFKDLGLSKSLIDNIYVITKKQRKETLKKLKEENYDLFIQIPQNIGIYKSIRNILLVRFYLKINSAFGWDYGRVKSFMRFQKQQNIIPTETNRFVETLRQNDFYGYFNYPLESLAPKNQEIYKLIHTARPVAFLIGGKLQPKKWPLDHWVSLANLIDEEQKILIIGGNDEKDDAEYIKTRTINTINLCGFLAIPELLYVFQNTKIAISLDTGAMHLCDAAGTKLIALFSTRDLSNKWFPNNRNSIVIEKVLDCSFCLKTKNNNNICMSNILPDEVYSKMNELLST
ncbi:MAG: glycosyltransferase family 9 protein [Proteobacteria bacterium]|nr:glycosyltransferase family 9 protein [Pseudomonadota bacterium]